MPQPFLDIMPLVGSTGFEQGLLGLAFHPQYRHNGRFFVNYTDTAGHTVVAAYTVSPDPDRADPTSGMVVLTVEQPFNNHNGGHLAFGSDGYLYIGLGDGGSAGDPYGNAQNPAVLLGKMLRLDIDQGAEYAIPTDNPFINHDGFRPEIWALGLRNPWRYSFDRVTGDLYTADVGQDAYEEVNFQLATSTGGENYGWNIMEGTHCLLNNPACNDAGLVAPVAEYGREGGCSITGGHVYRGQAQPALIGAYFFADFCSGKLWSLQPTEDGQWMVSELLTSGVNISSFGEDEAGELYLTGHNDGNLYHLRGEP